MMEHIRRTRADLHSISLDTRFGLECHVRKSVPPTSNNRLVVIICRGRKVKTIHRGVTSNILISSVVRAGLVVAEVAVLWVDRKSVSSNKGSRSTLHLEVNTFKVSTISSNVFWCFVFVISESSLLCPFFCLSPVQPEDDNGEYLLEYIPKINAITITTGPAYLITTSPYNTTPQKPATNKKLSHGSPLVQVNNPTNLLSGSKNGCEYANALVICGGV